MPVYVYRNLETNETFEYEQRITEDALTTDPRTGDPVRRVIQPVGIAFKGSGFYVNDSRNSGSTATAAGKSNTSDSADSAGKTAGSDSSASGDSGGKAAASTSSTASSGSAPANP